MKFVRVNDKLIDYSIFIAKVINSSIEVISLIDCCVGLRLTLAAPEAPKVMISWYQLKFDIGFNDRRDQILDTTFYSAFETSHYTSLGISSTEKVTADVRKAKKRGKKS